MASNSQVFVDSVFRRKEEDSGFRARMRGAQSAFRETEIWGDLAAFCNLQVEDVRSVYVLIGSSIACEDSKANGLIPFGRLMSSVWGNDKDAKLFDDKKLAQHPAASRLRRLLACRDVMEVCRILRPCLQLIRSRQPGQLDYVQLLDDLLSFRFNPERTKARWVMDFHHSVQDKKTKEKEADHE